MAGTLTPLAVAILGLLVERPMHPYEMVQVLTSRATDRLVKVKPGSLYHTVDRLARDGLAAPMGVDRTGNRPERTTYEATPAGRSALEEQLTTMLAAPVNEYARFPLALAEAHNLPRDTVVDLLHGRLARLEGELAQLRAGIERVRSKDLPVQYWVDLTYQVAVYEAEQRWTAQFVADLEHGAVSW